MPVEKKWQRIYYREFGAAMAVYALLLVLTIKFGRQLDNDILRAVVLMTPAIGVGLVGWAVARHVARVDEYVRAIFLETLCIAGAITVGLAFSYGFLETAGYPRLSAFMIAPVMGVAWGVALLIRMRAGR